MGVSSSTETQYKIIALINRNRMVLNAFKRKEKDLNDKLDELVEEGTERDSLLLVASSIAQTRNKIRQFEGRIAYLGTLRDALDAKLTEIPAEIYAKVADALSGADVPIEGIHKAMKALSVAEDKAEVVTDMSDLSSQADEAEHVLDKALAKICIADTLSAPAVPKRRVADSVANGASQIESAQRKRPPSPPPPPPPPPPDSRPPLRSILKKPKHEAKSEPHAGPPATVRGVAFERRVRTVPPPPSVQHEITEQQKRRKEEIPVFPDPDSLPVVPV